MSAPRMWMSQSSAVRGLPKRNMWSGQKEKEQLPQPMPDIHQGNQLRPLILCLASAAPRLLLFGLDANLWPGIASP